MKLSITQIARIVHEANAALCIELGDHSQSSWSSAPSWQKESAIKGVEGIANGTIWRPEQSHESWLHEKESTGWVYAPVKDPEAKTHPCMIPYDQLPPEQQLKDHLFFAIVRALI